MDSENSSIFQPYQKYECWRGDKQTILKTSIGRQLPYIVNFKRNTCQIFDVEWERVTHSYTFPEGCELVDVDYFPTKEGKLGILVAVEDPRQSWEAEHFVVALAANSDDPMMTVTHSAEIPSRITVIKTLFSCADMANTANREVLKLYHRMMTWQHVVAIGCKETKCFLARLTPVEPSASLVIPIHSNDRNLINLMGAFTSSEEVFQYTQNDGSYKDYPTAAVYISALALMPRSRTLLVGLSMGGILAASLNPSNQMSFLELRHERLIRKIAPLEPEDDPDKFEYFIAAVDSSPRHPIMFQLWRGSFKTFEEVEEEVKYDKPYFTVCLEHKILFGEKWISVNPIVTDRDYSITMRKRGKEESILNESRTFGATSTRNAVLMSFERQKVLSSGDDPNGLPEYIVEAAIFDIDAWYYKRVPGRVSTDGTVLKQCAFMSTIKSNVLSDGVNDIGILAMNATDVSRFTSMISDADQLFYPSALTYERVFVAKNANVELMKIQNIQDTILNKCASKLPYYLHSADSVSGIILAAGLVRKNILSGSPNSSAHEAKESELSIDQKVLLNLIVYYGKVEELCGIVERKEISDALKTEIADWAVHEAVDFKRTVSDKLVAIFQGRSQDLSPLAQEAITQGIKLFRVVYEYLKACSKHLKSSRLHNLAHSMKCLRNHTKLTHQFITFGIIPVNTERQQKIRHSHAKKKLAAIRNSSSLPVQAIIRNMNRLAPNAQFWDDVSHSEWYPPTPVDLLESLLSVNIPERMKREVVVQYVVDWIRASGVEMNEKQLAIETIKVMTNQMLEVDLEKIYFVLDQEKKALTYDKRAEEVRALGEKVFSMQKEEVTYEKLWGGGVPVTVTINQQDMKRFEQRLRMQMGQGNHRLPVLDPESEKLYQVYLFENEKYDAMSSEAIKANKLLSMFMPGMYQKRGLTPQKSAKEKEIEQSVRTMFQRQKVLEDKEVVEGDVVAVVKDQKNRKRSNQFGDDEDTNSSVASGPFVPPTAKKIYETKKAADPIPPFQEPTIDNNSSITSLVNTDDTDHNHEINMLIATPARYYKRPNDDDFEPGLCSPTAEKLPPPPAQNSILKTAKAVQSASRGRIRFHESVPRGADESIEHQKDAPKGLTLNFAILEDEEEEETMTTRRSRTIETQGEVEKMEEVMEDGDEAEEKEEDEDEEEDDMDDEECVEEEKSFEKQDEFEVLEDTSAPEQRKEQAEETFEPREDDIMPPMDETYESPEEQPIQKTQEKQDEVAEKEEEIQKKQKHEESDDVVRSAEVQSEDESDTPEEENREKEEEFASEEVEKEAGIPEEPEKEGIVEEDRKDIQEEVLEVPVVEQPEDQKSSSEVAENVTVPKPEGPALEEVEEPVHSSFEVQEETEPISIEAPVGADRPSSRNTRTRSTQDTPAPIHAIEEDSGPPSTRTRTRSSSVRQNDLETDTPTRRSYSRSSKARSQSVDHTNDVATTSRTPTKCVASANSRSQSRSQSVDITEATEVQETPKRRGRPRLSSLTTPSGSTRKREGSVVAETETVSKKRRGRPAATPMKVIPENEPSTSTSKPEDVSVVATPRGRGRPRKVPLENLNEEEEEAEESVASTSLRRSTRRSQQQ